MTEEKRAVKVVKRSKIRCPMTKQNGEPCPYYIVPNSRYCNNHDYCNAYTEEQMRNLKRCSTCKRDKFIEEGYSVCKEDRERSIKNNAKKKEVRVLCTGKTEKDEPCPFSAITENGGLCHECKRKADLVILVQQTQNKGKKLCYNNGKRNAKICLKEIDQNGPSKCEPCLQYDREKDKRSTRHK